MRRLLASGGQGIAASPSASVLPNEYSELISLRTDWFDLLAVQGILSSLFQYHNSKTSVIWCSAFFVVQLSRIRFTLGEVIKSVLFYTLIVMPPSLLIPLTYLVTISPRPFSLHPLLYSLHFI